MRLVNSVPVRIETRADGTKGLVGYAAVFYRADDSGTEFWLWDNYVERIMPGAFDEVAQDDVRALFNHDPSRVLGRAASKTLSLVSDDTGLRYEIELPKTREAEDLAILVERGDVTGSSFAFTPTSVTYREEEDLTIREINGVTLYDVGPVTYPAYEATSVSVRDADICEAKVELEKWQREQRMAQAERDRVIVRCGLVEKDLTRNLT